MRVRTMIVGPHRVAFGSGGHPVTDSKPLAMHRVAIIGKSRVHTRGLGRPDIPNPGGPTHAHAPTRGLRTSQLRRRRAARGVPRPAGGGRRGGRGGGSLADDAGGRAVHRHGSETGAPNAFLGDLRLFSGLAHADTDSQTDQAEPIAEVEGSLREPHEGASSPGRFPEVGV